MTTQADLSTGLQFARNKQYKEAVEEFTKLVSREQTYADAFFYRGCAYLQLGEYKKAINDFNLAIPSSKFSTKHEPLAFYKRGYAYYKTNQFDSALDDYRYYLKRCENPEEQNNCFPHKGYFQMGIIYAAMNQNDEAISHFKDAIDNSEGSEEAKQKLYYLHRGRAYACIAKYDEAEKDLKFVLQKNDDSFAKGCAYNELGQHRLALIEFDNLQQSNGSGSKLVETQHDHILFRQGLSCASLNLHGQALNHFQSALNHSKQQNSSDITDRILFRKGMSNMVVDHPHRALVDFNESTNINDNQSDVFYARGMLQYKLGRHDAAVYDQRKAMELERKSSSLAPVHKIFYRTTKYGDIYNNNTYYENKICEKKELLKKYQHTLIEPIIHRMIADYLQKYAPFSNNPLTSCNTACGHIKAAIKCSDGSLVANKIALACNYFYRAQLLTEMYSKGNSSQSVIDDYLKCSTDSLIDIRKLFDEYVTKIEDLNDLIKSLYSELNQSNIQQVSPYDIAHNTYIMNLLEKSKIMKEKMALFADSPEKQEFYKCLVTRVWNLFDGIRTASTGIFSHSLEGTFTKVSWIFKALGKLFSLIPIVSEYGQTVSGICATGLKKLDEIRIQNALEQLGSILNPTTANETADAIVTQLTFMYEDQIKRFFTTTEENSQQQQQQSTSCSNCFHRCCRCLEQKKDNILNKAEHSTMRAIVEYGVTLLMNCLVQLKSDDITNTENIQSVFVNGVCRSSDIIIFPSRVLADKIKPKDVNNKSNYWNTFDFYRRPAIKFEDGTIRAQKEGDPVKFGYRKSTLEEEELLKDKPDEFKKFGFKIDIKIDNSS